MQNRSFFALYFSDFRFSHRAVTHHPLALQIARVQEQPEDRRVHALQPTSPPSTTPLACGWRSKCISIRSTIPYHPSTPASLFAPCIPLPATPSSAHRPPYTGSIHCWLAATLRSGVPDTGSPGGDPIDLLHPAPLIRCHLPPRMTHTCHAADMGGGPGCAWGSCPPIPRPSTPTVDD
jgi:hypothetical protein